MDKYDVLFNGEVRKFKDLLEEYEQDRYLILPRLLAGMSIEQAFKKPLK